MAGYQCSVEITSSLSLLMADYRYSVCVDVDCGHSVEFMSSLSVLMADYRYYVDILSSSLPLLMLTVDTQWNS